MDTSLDLPLLAPNFNFYQVYFGEMLNNRYKVLRKAGGGAHSSVWLVQDTKFGENESEGETYRYIPVRYPYDVLLINRFQGAV